MSSTPTIDAATPLTFLALFPRTTPPDLLLAMAFLGSDGQIYWAERLQG